MNTMRRWIFAFFVGLADFLIGDDWFLAAGVVVVLGVAAIVGTLFASWWVLIVGVPTVLWISLRRATR